MGLGFVVFDARVLPVQGRILDYIEIPNVDCVLCWVWWASDVYKSREKYEIEIEIGKLKRKIMVSVVDANIPITTRA